MQDESWSILEQLESLSDNEALRKGVAATVQEFGFSSFAYHDLRPWDGQGPPFFLSTYPISWTSHYTAQTYRDVDPVVLTARRASQPFEWSPEHFPWPLTGDQQRLFNEAREWKIRRGVTIPIHGPGTTLTLFSVVADLPARKVRNFQLNHLHELRLTALSLHAAVERIRIPDVPTIDLTRRQRECLLWTARGKTAWEIGEILSISQETVVFHLKAAMRKFGVYSKHLAVVKAIMFGLIQP